jgi:outer membrane receptor protein involved in Fe transport
MLSFGSLALAIALSAAQIAAGPVSGTVRDASGRVIAGAVVVLSSAGGVTEQSVTGPDGRFTIPVPAPTAGDVTVVIRAPGFAEARRSLAPGALDRPIDVQLQPAGLAETVTVTASRMEQRLADVPASVNVVTQDDIRRSPAVVADDVLRQIPSFSLFRRTSSLASHPTAQGVSLRGLGPSGVSRTLVLLDGIPFNDSFGGWVYWTRVPLEAAERIEVVDSSSSSLYGNYAMGGVINIVTSPALRRTVEMKAQYGTRNTPKVDVLASDVWGKVGVVVDGTGFTTDGYPIVVAVNPAGVRERGAVDKNASVSFKNANVKLHYNPSDRLQAFLRGGYFREERINGKASTFDGTDEQNDTTWTSASAGIRLRTERAGSLQASVFTDVGTFRSNFLAVPGATPPRSIGRMSLNQRVPSDSVGGSLQWSRALGRRQFFSAGVDGRWVDGDSEEDVLDGQTGAQVILRRVSGGTQRSLGVFAQDVVSVSPRLTMTLSARVDRWRNYAAHNLETSVPSGTPTGNHDPALPSRDDTVASPRVAARYQLHDRVSVWGDLGWGFRAPTLNELYRQFRVGTVITLANNQLGPERLVGGELGVTWTPARNVMVRSTWFDNRVKDPVSNVTIATAGATVTQQRQNLGRTRIRGLQQDVEIRAGASWRFTGGYLYERAEVTEFAAVPALVGNLLPQVPRHRGSVQAVYANPRYLTVALAVQAVGAQFDDDLNLRSVPGLSSPGLPGYVLASLTASRSIGRNVELFVGVQNLADEQYFVGTLPTTVGSPRLVSGGVRIRFAGASR